MSDTLRPDYAYVMTADENGVMRKVPAKSVEVTPNITRLSGELLFVKEQLAAANKRIAELELALDDAAPLCVKGLKNE